MGMTAKSFPETHCLMTSGGGHGCGGRAYWLVEACFCSSLFAGAHANRVQQGISTGSGAAGIVVEMDVI